MFSTISMTGSGIVVYILGLAFSHFGLTIGNEQLTAAVEGGMQVIGLVGLVIGQVRRGDLHFGLFRKTQ